MEDRNKGRGLRRQRMRHDGGSLGGRQHWSILPPASCNNSSPETLPGELVTVSPGRRIGGALGCFARLIQVPNRDVIPRNKEPGRRKCQVGVSFK